MANKIIVRPDGPLVITGNIIIRDASSNILLEDSEAWLCRCGQTAKPPFCDGAHKKTSFEDAADINDQRKQDLENSDAKTDTRLEITVRENAMLLCNGPVTITNKQQTQSTTRNKVALCRCGKSNNKPFCDASHKH